MVGDVVSRIFGKPGITLSKAKRTADGSVSSVYYVKKPGMDIAGSRGAVDFGSLSGCATPGPSTPGGWSSSGFPIRRWPGTTSAGDLIERVVGSSVSGTLKAANRAGEMLVAAYVPLMTAASGVGPLAADQLRSEHFARLRQLPWRSRMVRHRCRNVVPAARATTLRTNLNSRLPS